MSLDLPGGSDQAIEPVTTPEQLIEDFRRAEKPRATHRLGLEHEKFVYPVGGATPVPYEGTAGIGVLLEALARDAGAPFREQEGGPIIAVQRGSQTLSLEPGGQLELSGTAATTARAAHAENLAHLNEARRVGASLNLRLVALGYRPFGTPPDMPWMPKTRYAVMRQTLGGFGQRRGALAHHMMQMTCTGQVSIDWESEEDCARKLTVFARMAPELVALYANSPLVNGKPEGRLSFRSHVWTAVDSARCGFFPAMLKGCFQYRDYVEWALDAPLLFLRHGGEYLTPELSFRTLLAKGFQGRPATRQDWHDHLSTLFPEVRLKTVMELRSADCVSAPLTGALAALARGLAYHPDALREAEASLPRRPFADHLARMELARRQGLRDRELAASAWALVKLAREGLKRLDAEDAALLDPLEERAEDARSPAEDVLEAAAKARGPAALLDCFTV